MELSFKVSVVVTLGALAVLAIYWVSAIPHFDFDRWALNIGVGPDGKPVELPDGGGPWLPFGSAACSRRCRSPCGCSSRSSSCRSPPRNPYDPKTDMPKGLIFGMTTLMVSALLITFLNSGVGSTEPDKMHGAFSLATSAEPLLDGFRVIYGTGIAKLLAFLAVIGLIASFHTIIYAYGRQIYSLSRAGYYLPFMSVTHGTHKVPHMALLRRHRDGLRHHAGRSGSCAAPRRAAR